ncbi:hypothetical protein ACFX2C_047247 [Malus domestica]
MPLVLLVLGAMDLDLEFFTLLADLKSRRDKLILMAGLNGSGKTTILNKIHSEGVSTEIVTPGFSVETVKHAYINLAAFDVGSENRIPPLYMQHFQNKKGLIFVVDSNDQNRVLEARDELHRMLQEDELKNVVVLVLANKQDLCNAMTAEELSKELDIKSLRINQWHISSTCAISGDGLLEALRKFFWAIDSMVPHVHVLICVDKDKDISCSGEEIGKDEDEHKDFQSTIQEVFTQNDWVPTPFAVNPEFHFTCVSRLDYIMDCVQEACSCGLPVDLMVLDDEYIMEMGQDAFKSMKDEWHRAEFDGHVIGVTSRNENIDHRWIDPMPGVLLNLHFSVFSNKERVSVIFGHIFGNRYLSRASRFSRQAAFHWSCSDE